MRQTKKSKPRFSKLSVFIAVYSVITTLALVAIGSFVYFNHLVLANLNQQDETIIQLIGDAIGGLSAPLPRDARSGNYYIPESKLTFSSLNAPKSLTYYVEDNDIHIPAQKAYAMALSHSRSVNKLEESFSYVPKMQACSRGYLLTFSSPDTELGVKVVFDKKLRDGRTLTVAKDTACPNFDSETEEALRTIDSY